MYQFKFLMAVAWLLQRPISKVSSLYFKPVASPCVQSRYSDYPSFVQAEYNTSKDSALEKYKLSDLSGGGLVGDKRYISTCHAFLYQPKSKLHLEVNTRVSGFPMRSRGGQFKNVSKPKGRAVVLDSEPGIQDSERCIKMFTAQDMHRKRVQE